MKAVACLVRQTANAWVVSLGELQPLVLNAAETKPAGLAQSVVDYLETARPKYGSCTSNIVLCPESRATLFATSPIPKALKTKDRQQLKFHAESLLPLDAEEMAADFVLTAKDLRIMAIDRAEWQPIIDAFAARDLHFRWIAPASVLALQEAKKSLDGARVVLWEEDGQGELWQLDAAGIASWTHLSSPLDDQFSAMRLFAARSSDIRTWTAINCSLPTLEQLGQLKGIEVRAIELNSQSTYASAAANRLCQSPFEAWFDLRDGSIAGDDRYRALSGWIRATVAAVAVLLLVSSAAFWWKSIQATSQTASIQAAHEELFQNTFPGDRIPVLISKTIANEHQKLQGETNGKGELEPVPSALELLHATLSALATGEVAPFRATTLSIQNGLLDLDLTFESEKDARVIANRLKEVGIDTGPLGTTQDKDGKWNAVFKGKMVSKRNPAVQPGLSRTIDRLITQGWNAIAKREMNAADRRQPEQAR